MTFRLPEITYPLTVDTIGKTLALGDEITVHCHNYGCGHHGRLNLVAIARKVGMDYSCLAPDLKKLTHCPRCREAGRAPKNIGFISHALTRDHCEWPYEREVERRQVGRTEAKGGSLGTVSVEETSGNPMKTYPDNRPS